MKNHFRFGKNFPFVVFAFIIFSLLGSNNFSNLFKFGKNVLSEMNDKSIDEKILVWIEFNDKGNNTAFMLSHPELYLTKESIERRKKVKPLYALVDFTDIPVNNQYLNELFEIGTMYLKLKNEFGSKIEDDGFIDSIPQNPTRLVLHQFERIYKNAYAKDHQDVTLKVLHLSDDLH